ncbi:MAG: glycosyltransferase family 2 protein [Weeksellaceae bacterium]
MKTAVVILNWNGRKLMEEFLPSVVEHSAAAAIVVIDNASTDDSVDWLKNHYPEIQIVINSGNFGYARGYNEGLRELLKKESFDLLCLLNSDVQVTKNWLQPILEIFVHQPKVAAVQPKILDYKNPEYFEYAGAGGGFIDNFGYPFCRGRVFWTLEKDLGQFDDSIPVFWASGACFFIRTGDFLDSGGFDEAFFAHMEEIDLCWRLKNKGREIYYCGASTVYHLGGGTLKANSPEKTYLNFRNNLSMLVKNLPQWKVFPIIFLRLILDGITGIVFLFYEGFSHCFAVVRAHFGFYVRLPGNLKLRKPGISNYYKGKFVPLKYFLAKKKCFSELDTIDAE